MIINGGLGLPKSKVESIIVSVKLVESAKLGEFDLSSACTAFLQAVYIISEVIARGK